MEILITSLALATVLVLAMLIGTRGQPMKFIAAVGNFVMLLPKNKAAVFYTGLIIFLVLGFLYFFYDIRYKTPF